MKLPLHSLYVLSLILICCQQQANNILQIKDTTKSIIIDSTVRTSIIKNINHIYHKKLSFFETPVEARFYLDGVQEDSIIENKRTLSSWYYTYKDTITLITHAVGGMETETALIKFINGKPIVTFFRAPHQLGGS